MSFVPKHMLVPALRAAVAQQHNAPTGETKKKRKKLNKYAREVLFETSSRLCPYCGVQMRHERWGDYDYDVRTQATVDHKIPTAKGGLNTLSNAQLCCQLCNNTKGHQMEPPIVSVGRTVTTLPAEGSLYDYQRSQEDVRPRSFSRAWRSSRPERSK